MDNRNNQNQSSTSNSELVTISKGEYEQMQRENRKLQTELANTLFNLEAANSELEQLKDADTHGSTTNSSINSAHVDVDATSDLLSALIDDLIQTCKITGVSSRLLKPKLMKLDELYNHELDEQIKIARLLLLDVNHELVGVYGRKSKSSAVIKSSAMFDN